jgi:hypothetical protein
LTVDKSGLEQKDELQLSPTMASSKKITQKKTTAPKPTPTSLSWSKKKAAMKQKSTTHTLQSATSSQSLRQPSVKEEDDDKPTHVDDTLDADGDTVMEHVDDGDKTTSSQIELSDDEGMEVEDDEAELSMHLIYIATAVRSTRYNQ